MSAAEEWKKATAHTRDGVLSRVRHRLAEIGGWNNRYFDEEMEALRAAIKLLEEAAK